MEFELKSEVSAGMVMTGQDRAGIRTMAQKIENAGFDSIWVGDHIAFHIPVLESLSLLRMRTLSGYNLHSLDKVWCSTSYSRALQYFCQEAHSLSNRRLGSTELLTTALSSVPAA